MKLREFLTRNNIIEELHTTASWSYTWATQISARELESTLLIKYGDREVYSAYSHLNSGQVAFHLYFLYNSKWEQVFDTLKLLKDIPMHSHHVSKTTEDNTDISEQTDVSNRVQKEQGYNVNEWVETEGSDDKEVNQSTRDRGMVRGSMQGSLSNIRNNIDRVQQLQLHEIICADIVKSLCLAIY